MSSIMRRRSGLMGAWLMGAPGLEVRFLTPRSSNQDASHSPHFTYLRHQRHAVRPACLKLARSAFVHWHETVVAVQSLHVCCRGQSGKYLLGMSISHSD